MGSEVALVKGIARWDFRLIELRIFFGFGLMRSPNGISGSFG